MKQYSLGVIGGMGPKATSVFFDKIVENTHAHKDQEHINMVILNHSTLPDRTTSIFANTGEVFLEHIKEDVKLLEMAGVNNIAIPCNTSHYFYDELVKLTDINVINMIEETVREIYNQYGESSKVGILATKGTISSGIYDEVCKKYNIKLHVPSQRIQEHTMKIIYDNVKGDLSEDPSELESLIMDFLEKENCSCVILACTELSCIKLRHDIKKHCVDALEVLVNRCIQLSGKKIKK